MEITTKSGKKISFDFAHYGEERALNMTDGEKQVAEYLQKLCPLEIVRKSDDYLTAVYKEYDVVRFKCTERAKWLNICFLDLGKVKRRFENLEDLAQFDEDIIKSYKIALNNG